MKICMVISTPLPPGEGIAFYIWNLSRFLRVQGHQVQVITRGEGRRPYYEVVEGIPIWRPLFLPVYPLHVHLHGLFVQKLVKRLEGGIDLFHFHTPLPPPVRSTRPILLTVHNLMLADARARKTDGLYDLLTKLMTPISTSIERRLFSVSRGITAVSQPVADKIQQRLNCEGGCVRVMWNGVDHIFFSPSGEVQADPNNLLFVGRLAPGKGLRELILAFKLVVTRAPGARLSIIGDGPLRDMTAALIRKNGLEDHVNLIGHVNSREEIRAHYRRAWGLIMPSLHEGLPGVLLEAMACGTPVIATRVGGIPEVVRDEVNGILIPPGDADAIAGAACHLIRNADLRGRLGEAARGTIEKQFPWQIIGENYLSLYSDILAAAGDQDQT
jgi:glycosyltransferase involved in cell wall biosynthesis